MRPDSSRLHTYGCEKSSINTYLFSSLLFYNRLALSAWQRLLRGNRVNVLIAWHLEKDECMNDLSVNDDSQFLKKKKFHGIWNGWAHEWCNQWGKENVPTDNVKQSIKRKINKKNLEERNTWMMRGIHEKINQAHVCFVWVAGRDYSVSKLRFPRSDHPSS